MTTEEFNKRLKAGEKWKLAGEKAAAKYHNARTTQLGEQYHSGLEADDGTTLIQWQKDNVIADLQRQVRFRCWCNGRHITDSIVDFRFTLCANGMVVWYESKGLVTDAYRIKKELILAQVPDGETYIVNMPDLLKYIRLVARKKA